MLEKNKIPKNGRPSGFNGINTSVSPKIPPQKLKLHKYNTILIFLPWQLSCTKKDLTSEGIVGKSGLGSCILINTQIL